MGSGYIRAHDLSMVRQVRLFAWIETTKVQARLDM